MYILVRRTHVYVCDESVPLSVCVVDDSGTVVGTVVTTFTVG